MRLLNRYLRHLRAYHLYYAAFALVNLAVIALHADDYRQARRALSLYAQSQIRTVQTLLDHYVPAIQPHAGWAAPAENFIQRYTVPHLSDPLAQIVNDGGQADGSRLAILPLLALIDNMLRGSDVHLAILDPQGRLAYANGSSMLLAAYQSSRLHTYMPRQARNNLYYVIGNIDPMAAEALWHSYAIRGTIGCLATSLGLGLFFTLAGLYSRRHAPERREQALWQFGPSVSPAMAKIKPAGGLNVQLATQIDFSRRSDLQLRLLQEEQRQLMRSLEAEMQHAAGAIDLYAGHLQELVLHRQIAPERQYDFDDVSETGESLKSVARSFQLMHQLKAGEYLQHPTVVPLEPSVLSMMKHLEHFIERRSLNLLFDPGLKGAAPIADETLFHHALWSMCLMAVRNAANDTLLHIAARSQATGTVLQISIGQLDSGALDGVQYARSKREKGAVVASASRLTHALLQQIHSQIAMTLMRAMQGSYSIYSKGGSGIVMEAFLPAA